MSDVKSLFNKKKKTVSKAKPVQTAVKSAVEAPNEDDDWGVPAQEQEVMFVTKAVGQLSTAPKEPEDLAVRVVAEDTRQIFHQVRAKAVMGPTSPPASAPPPEEIKEAPKPLAGSRPGVWRSSRVQAAEGGPAVPFKTKVEEFPALGPTPAAHAAKTAATKVSAWARINALNAEEQQPEQAQHQQEEQVQQSPETNAKEAPPVEPAGEAETAVPEPEQRKEGTKEEQVQDEKSALVPESAPVSAPPAPSATPAPPVPPAEEPKAEAATEAPQEEEAQPANLKSKFGPKKKKKTLDF